MRLFEIVAVVVVVLFSIQKLIPNKSGIREWLLTNVVEWLSNVLPNVRHERERERGKRTVNYVIYKFSLFLPDFTHSKISSIVFDNNEKFFLWNISSLYIFPPFVTVIQIVQTQTQTNNNQNVPSIQPKQFKKTKKIFKCIIRSAI